MEIQQNSQSNVASGEAENQARDARLNGLPTAAREDSVLPSARDRWIASGAHLCSLLNFFVPVLLPALVLLELENQFHTNRFVAGHVEQALAFQFFYFLIALSLASALVGQIYCIPLAPLLILLGLYCNLRGVQAARRGETYAYPFVSLLLKA